MPDLSGAMGAEYAEENAPAGGFGGRIEQVRFENKKYVQFRMLTPQRQWLTLSTHSYIPTKPQPANWKGKKWPGKMWSICQDDKAFLLRDGDGQIVAGSYEDGFGSCPIHRIYAGQKDQYSKALDKAVPVTYALVVLVEPVFESGEFSHFADKIETYEDGDGNKTQVPAVRYVAQKWGNFFSPIKNTVVFSKGEVRDRVWQVQRDGTEYTVTSVAGPEGQPKPDTDEWKPYTDALALMGIDLAKMLLAHADTEHYNRFFVPQADDGKAPEADGESDVSEPDAGKGDQPTDDEIQNFAAGLAASAKS